MLSYSNKERSESKNYTAQQSQPANQVDKIKLTHNAWKIELFFLSFSFPKIINMIFCSKRQLCEFCAIDPHNFTNLTNVH